MTANHVNKATPAAASCFPQFASLPAEIREIIWRFAAFPRIVYLELIEATPHYCSRIWSQTSIEGPESMGFFDLDNQSETAREGIGLMPGFGFRSSSVPVLFYVSREANDVAKEMYTKCFGTRCMAPATWFNFDRDTLYLDFGLYRFLDEHRRSQLQFEFDVHDIRGIDTLRVQNLALYHGDYPEAYPEDYTINEILSAFGNVRNLTMVPKLGDITDYTSLVYLEKEDGLESPCYQKRGHEERLLHPVILSMYPHWANELYSHDVWADGEGLWTDPNVFSLADRINNDAPRQLDNPTDTNNPDLLKWARPSLQIKPIITSQQKLDFLRRREQFDATRSARRIPLKLMAMRETDLEMSVPPLTNVANLVTIFCRARKIDMSENSGSIDEDPLVFCYWESDCEGHDPEETVYSLAIGNDDDIILKICFCRGGRQRPHCSEGECARMSCRHTEGYSGLRMGAYGY